VVSVFSGAGTYSNAIKNATLLQALSFNGGNNVDGAARNLLRSAVAALLNATGAYPLTQAQVISQVNTALGSHNRSTMLTLASRLDGYNNVYGGCTRNL
jgi:hypothetical protein